ncbi:AraC family transcriptional regulator [Streptomyces sp. NPDC059479]|uniref:AraC family transcriptional regulator n=1 Tax=Streptomyces sp. NPDC059479 TaxID=3346848 RepID=UPI0036B3D584
MDIVGDVITSIRTGTPIARRAALYGPWGLRFVGDPGAGFHVVLQGTAWMRPSHGGSPVELGAGDVVFAASGDGYALADQPGTPLSDVCVTDPAETWPLTGPPPGAEPSTLMLCGMYSLDRARPHPLISQLPPVIRLPARAATGDPLRSVVDLLGTELDHSGPGTSAAVPALLDLLLIFSLRTWYDRQAAQGATGWARALKDPPVSTALVRMHDSPASPWTVSRLAGEAGLSRTAFARRFTELIGEPPLTYLTRWRMTLAGRLLRESDLPLASVAARVGYGSEYAFSKAFRRALGRSPGAHRRAHRTSPTHNSC